MTAKKTRELTCKGITASDFIIKITDQDSSPWTGSIVHVYSGQAATLRGYLEMTFLIHKKLDELNFPQATTILRSWVQPPPLRFYGQRNKYKNSSRGEDNMQKSGRKISAPSKGPTFFIRIHYRQNATWQGSIQWLEGKSTKFFRSHLEMIMLMQEAIEKSGNGKAECEFQSWDEQEEVYS